MIRAALLWTLLLSALALAGASTPALCFGEDAGQSPGAATTDELSPEMLALLRRKNMPLHSPILIRVFKEEAELEVWKQDSGGRFQMVKTYPICRWSGDLGPKLHEGDRQAPEGFYTITTELMNPNSNYYRAINTGFPNSFDKANDRDGSFLMIHGDCSSSGCYAMTDEQIGEIFALARGSLDGEQGAFQVQAYPFRLTPANLARHRTSPHLAFWKMLKVGNDHFETSHLEPRVDVCDHRYVFDAQPPPNSSKPLVFDPVGRCPAFVVNPKIAALAQQKHDADEAVYVELVRENVPAAPGYSGLDGGMNKVFFARFPGRIIPLARVLLDGIRLPHMPPVPYADNSGSLASKYLDALTALKPRSQRRLAAAGSNPERGADQSVKNEKPNAEQVSTRPNLEPPKAEAPKLETPKAEAAKVKAEAPKAETPKAEAPKVEAAKVKAEAPKAEAARADSPPAEAPEVGQQQTTAAQRDTHAVPPARDKQERAPPVTPADSFVGRWSGLQ